MRTLRIAFTALGLTLLSSCAPIQEDESSALAVGNAAQAEGDQAALATSAEELAKKQTEQPGAREKVFYRGNDRLVNMPAKQEAVKFVGEDVSLNFEQAPLSEVTHAILGDILQLDYLVDKPISGNVTLRTRTPIPRDQLLDVLESLLKSNGTILIRRADGRYLVTGENQGTRLAPTVSNPGNTSAGYSTVIVPLQYISAGAMAEILRPVADESAFLRIDNARNLMMLAGTREQIDGWMEMVSTFDVDQLQGMSVGLFPLENSSVEEVTAALDAMMGATEEGAGMKSLIRVVPVERLNSILIVTPRAHYLDSVEKWIDRLDDAHHSEYDSRLYVYPVQNTTAERLADLLNRIYSGEGGNQRSTSGGSVRDAGGVAPGMSAETIGSTGTGSAGSSLSGGSTGSSSSNFQMEGGGREAVADVRVVADDENNALMIYASPMQYRIIEGALKQLDVEATQIIIEASIMEVTLTDELRYGLEWTFNNQFGDREGFGSLINLADTTSPASQFPGFSYVLTNGQGDVSAVLNALAQDSLLNIISSPSVMVLDNQSAYIHVGQQVPIIDSQTGTLNNSNADFDRVTQSITYKDTGVKLEVKPSVNAGGLVTMDVKQSVTDVGNSNNPTGQSSFLERNIQSRVAVRSGESVVLGGLIQENSSEGSQGVPWLHEIPVIGALFGVDNSQTRRTELLVIITPRALYNAQELRDVSREMRSRVRNLDLITVPMPASSVPASATTAEE